MQNDNCKADHCLRAWRAQAAINDMLIWVVEHFAAAGTNACATNCLQVLA